MAKFSEASPEVQELVKEVANELGLAQQGLDFEALCVTKAKDVVTVSKASAVVEYLSNREDLILIICFEEAFDMVDDQTKHMWVLTAMEQILVDNEKNKVSIGVPSINVPISLLTGERKMPVINTAILGKETIAQIEAKRKKEKEDAKEAKKAAREAKKGNTKKHV